MRTIVAYVLPALLLTSASLSVCAPRALAQSDDLPPSTLTLDRMDSATRIGIQVGFDKLDEVSLSDGFVMRFNPYAQHVLPNRVVAVYGQLPVAHVFDFHGSDATGIGNLEGGAYFMPFHDSTLILRTGLALGTAPRSGRDFAANLLSAFERETDYLLVMPESTTLRLSASTVQQAGVAFLRIDAGLDLVIDKPSGLDSTFVHANLAAGVRTPVADLSAELVTLGDLDESGDVSDKFIHTLSFGFRTRGRDQFYAGMVIPLDEMISGEIWIFTAGYQYATY